VGEELTLKKVENGWIIIEPCMVNRGRGQPENEEIVHVFERWDDFIQHLQERHTKGEI